VRIILFALLPAWGLGNAAATMVGQGLGAKDPERAERAVWVAGKMNAAFLGGVGVIFVLLSPQIVSLFGGTPEASAYAASCLRIVSLGFVFYGFGMVLVAAFNGAGAVWTPTIINFFCFWLLEIPLAWILASTLELGPNGIFIAMTIAFSMTAVVAGIVFKRGRWKTVAV
jgi:Na+-driven multidrug efflux pump